MSQKSIKSFFTGCQGGGDAESTDRERESNTKRKLQQQSYDTSKRKRKIQATWLSEYGWLEEEDGTLRCKVCREFPALADTSSSLYKGIASKFKKESFKFHEKSKKHIQCTDHKKAKNATGPSSLEKSARKLDELNSQKYEKLMNTAFYIASEGESFSKFPGLCNLQEKNGVSMGLNYRNRQACSGFVSSISDTIRQKTSQDLENTEFISILSDGATDKGMIEQEIVYVRYVNEQGKLITRLADVVDIEHGHAQGVKTGILEALNKVGLTTETVSEKLIGINTDGASVNMGKKGGAVKLLKDEINEHRTVTCDEYTVVVHCIAHNLELAVCDSKKGCPYLDKFEETLKGIFKFYYYSPKKRRELYDIAEALDKEVKHYGGVQQVRWVASQKRALQSLLDNYEVTCLHLGEIATKTGEDAARAKGYLQEIKTERFLTFLHFMIDWIGLITAVSEAFQQATCLVAEVRRKLDSLRDDLLHMKVRRGRMLRKFLRINERGDEFRGAPIVRGGQRRNIDSMERINADIDSLLTDSVFFLEERFVKHLGGEPHSLFNVFDFKVWPDKGTQAEEFRQYGDEEIEKLVELYSPFLSAEDKDNAEDQWLGLKNHLTVNLNRSLLSAYEAVLALSENDSRAFSAMLPLIKIMLTVSPSTAHCERGFSAMNALKTQGRTSLKQDSLSNLLRIKVDDTSGLDSFDPTDSLVTWLNAGKRHTTHKGTCPDRT